MSYEAMHKVRASGLSDRTQVDVLEALAFFQNPETGACYPSTEKIARISRVNDRLVRTTLKVLHDLGYVSSTQAPGQMRYFTLHLNRLPTADPLKESEPLQDSTPPDKSTPLKESAWEECRKVQGTPVEKCSSPLYETTPEQVNEQVIKQVKGTSNSLPERTPWETDHFDNTVKKIEKPKRQATDKGSRLSITELPDDWKAFAEQEEPDLDPKRLFENFKDYWNGLSGAKAIKKDWKGTWRNFVRSFHNAEDWKRRPMLKRAPTHSPSRPGQFVEKKQSERDYFDW